VVAFGIFLVALSMAFEIFHAGFDAVKSSEKRLQAIALAQAALEKAKTTPLSELPPQRFEVERTPLTVRLAHPVIAGSEQLRWSDGAAFAGAYRLNAETGELILQETKEERERGRKGEGEKGQAGTRTLEVSYGFVIEQTPHIKVTLRGERWQPLTDRRAWGVERGANDSSARRLTPYARRLTATATWHEGRRQRQVSLFLVRAQ
jgi:hypothetical protein